MVLCNFSTISCVESWSAADTDIYLESGTGESDQARMVGGKREFLCLVVRIREWDGLYAKRGSAEHYEVACCFN